MELSFSAVRTSIGNGFSTVGGYLVSAKVQTVSLITQYVAARIFATLALATAAVGFGYAAYQNVQAFRAEWALGRITTHAVAYQAGVVAAGAVAAKDAVEAQAAEVDLATGVETRAAVPAQAAVPAKAAVEHKDEVLEVKEVRTPYSSFFDAVSDNKKLVGKIALEVIGAVTSTGFAVYTAVKL